jgi:hypothetical protein
METTILRTIVDDLEVDLKQMYDDRSISKSQIAHWVIMVGNRLLSQHIGKRDSGAFLHIYGDIPVEVETNISNPNQMPGRKFIKLPVNIFDYDKDGGIEYITYYIDDLKPSENAPYTYVNFNRTTPSDLRRHYFSSFEKPSPENPYFFRAGEFIYLLGIECINTKRIEIGIYSTIKPITSDSIDLDMNFPFPEELLIVLKRQVLDMGRFVMMIPEDRVNDGKDDIGASQIPNNKLVSVNEMSEDVPKNQ